MQAINIPSIPPPAHSEQISADGEDDNRHNNDEIEKMSSTSLSGSPSRPPVSPITPVTPETPPENVDEEGGEAIRTRHHDEDTIKSDLPKTLKKGQPHSIDFTGGQTRIVPLQTKPKPAGPSATIPVSKPIPVLAPVPAPPTTYIPRPPSPVPISINSNPDAIALRSAISLLQMQRQRGQKDMQTLEEIKQTALKNPEQFVGELVAGRVKSGGPGGRMTSDVLLSSLRGVHDGEEQQQQQQQQRNENPQSDQNKNKNNMNEVESDNDDTEDDDQRSDQRQSKPTSSSESKFAPVPTPQNIFRCPPINWAKYHVVGESLDKIHAEQIARPPTGDVVDAVAGAGESISTGGAAAVHARNPPYVMRAPYSPFKDTVLTEGGKGNRKSIVGQKGGIGSG